MQHINIRNSEGGTALMAAAKNGQVEIAKRLLNKGSDINARTTIGSTALILAALNGHVEVVKLLLAKNADFNAKTSEGWTALDAAKRAPGLKTVIARGVIVTLLKQAGAKE